MKNFFTNLLDWIYKKRCYCCSSSKESLTLCSECYSSLDFNSNRPSRIISGVNVFICGSYDKNLQKMIRGLKYHNKKELAYYLSKFMAEYIEMIDLDKNIQIIPVPLHKKRQKARRYNHMELVGIELSKQLECDINFDLIKRVKDTKPQYKLSKDERRNNLENAFEVDFAKYENKKLLIIDDICTSGTTFEYMIKELQKNGIFDILCVATTTPVL